MIYQFNAIDNSVDIIHAIHTVMNEEYVGFETEDINILRNDDFNAIINLWYKYGYTEFRDYNYYIDIPNSKIRELIDKVCEKICVHNYDVKYTIIPSDECEDISDIYKENIKNTNSYSADNDDMISKIYTSFETKGTIFTVSNIFNKVTRNDTLVYKIYNNYNKDTDTLSYIKVVSEVNLTNVVISDYLNNIDKVKNNDSEYFQRGYIDKYNRLNIRFRFTRTPKMNIFFKVFYSHFKQNGYIVLVDSETISDEIGTVDTITIVI